MSIHAVVYLRVSTEEQAERGLSLRAQEETCLRFAGAHGWEVARVCKDGGLSGGLPLEKRPGLLEAVAVLRKGDLLLVAKRDRIFRGDPFDSAVIERSVSSRGARIVSVAGEGTGDDSPSSTFTRRVMDAVAELERRMIAARTRAVVDSKRARGEQLGRVPYGWRVDDDGKTLRPDPAEQEIAARIVELRRGGRLSLRAIAAELNRAGVPSKLGGAWSHPSVALVLRRYGHGPSV